MSKTLSEKIKDEISSALEEMNYSPGNNWQVYASDKSAHGHYATNAPMILAKSSKQSPMKLAEKLAQKMKNDFKIEVASPGFVNFFLTPKQLNQAWQEFLVSSDAQIKTKNPLKIQIEFVSANPTGPLTLGNGRGGFFGDVLGNILSKVGHKITKEYYINDAGFQLQRLGESILGLSEGSYRGEYIDNLKSIIRTKDAIEAGQQAADYILENMIKPDIKRMGLNFDVWFSERELYRDGLVEKTLHQIKEKKLSEEKEGAVWLKTTQFGDEKDRVLVKATGEMTYLMTDLAYHVNKFERGFDRVIDIWGADHQGHIAPLKQGLEALGVQSKQLEILVTQWVKVIKEGKEVLMSKRKGEYVTIIELIEEVGLDAVRYFFLSRSLNSHLNFDFDLAIKKSSDNPIYYIQYAHARMSSILRKMNISENEIDCKNSFILDHPSELNLIAELLHYPEVVVNISENYEVHKLPQYVYNLASAFHCFYRDCPIVNSEALRQEPRLKLLVSTKKILKESLTLMGISAPDKM